MKIAFIVQNLAHASDSVGFDCIFQYKILSERYGVENVRLFAEVYDLKIHTGVNIEPFGEFWNYYNKNNDAFVIYHFCDGWGSVDDLIIENIKNCIVRWHNNTAPWFYALEALDFANGCLSGFEVINRFARQSNARFLVNSDFTGRQLAALDGMPSRIYTVFPASTFLSKERSHAAPVKIRQTSIEADVIELLFVSRVVPHKGHKHILSTAAAVQRYTKKKVRVTFVGSMEQRLKDYWAGLQVIAADLGVDAVFTGLVSDAELLLLYQSCDVFICLSEHEGFGMPVFEAMRCHVPVVAWGTSALGELLADHPLMGTEFSIPHFAASVIAALDAEIRCEILPIQQAILTTYTYDAVVGQIFSAIDGIDEDMNHNDPVMPTLLDSDRYENIRRHVDSIACSIIDNFGSEISVFTHDAPVNYMSRYDIEAYRKLVELRRQEANGGRAQGRGSIREIHQRPFFIRAAQRNALDFGELELSISDLLSFDDEVFVKILYGTALGRMPENSALKSMVWRLRRGESKARLLQEIIYSDEACAFNRRIEGADAFMPLRTKDEPVSIIQEPVDVKKGLLNWFKPARPSVELSLAEAEASQPDTSTRLEDDPWPRLEDAVGRLRRHISPYTRRSLSDAFDSIHHVDELLQLGDEEFVAASYEFLLGRNVDQAGQEYWIGRLQSDLDRITFLRELANSPESANRADDLDGLADLLFGTGDVTSVTESKAGSRSLAWVENELGRVVNDLVAEAEVSPPAARVGQKEGSRRNLLRLAANAIQEVNLFERFGLSRLSEVDLISNSEINLPGTLFTAIKHIHQILITNDGTLPKTHPALVQRNIDSVKYFHPEAKYKLWGLAELRLFISRHFSSDVLHAFDTLKAYAFKADLGRYCLLYVYGGLYSDLSNLFLSPIIIEENKKVLCFREHKPLHGAFWMNQNTIIYSAPRQPEIKLAIDLVVENVKRRDYGVNSLAPSGPVLFGRVFAALGRNEVYQIEEALNLPAGNGLNRACYVRKDGTLVAVRLQGGGGRPSEIGIKGTNVYGEMWDRREIYSEGQMFFPHDHPSMHHDAASVKADCILIEPHMRGIAVFGPYIDLPIGTYEAIVSFYKDDWEGAFSLDVCCNQGSRILEGADNITLDDLGMACLQFSLTSPTVNVEVRIKTDGNFRGRFKDLTIRRIGSAASGLIGGHNGLKSNTKKHAYYAHSDEAIKTVCQREKDGIKIEKDFAGVAIFGPYISLEAGSYVAVVRFYTDMVEGAFTLDICHRSGEVIANTITDAQVDEMGSVRIPFLLDTSIEDLEVRVITNGTFAGKFRDLTIEHHQLARTETKARAAQVNAVQATIASRPEPVAWSHQFIAEDPSLGIDNATLMTAESIKAVYGSEKFALWTPDSLRSLIAERLSDEVLSAYDAAYSIEAKFTLGRYCVLYTLGGLYVAPGTILVNPLGVPLNKTIACFRSADSSAEAWAIDSSVVYAQREQPEVDEFIEQLMRFFEMGPSTEAEIKRFEDACFGRMLATHYRPEAYFGGEVVQLTRGYEKPNDCFLSFDGHLVALRN